MFNFLLMFMRCILVIALAFVPVANAMNMAAMETSQETEPPCHAQSTSQPDQDGTGGGHVVNHCHCAMAIGLPATTTPISHAEPLTDHPQTARRLALDQPAIPETPPPQPLA